jgi:hypothetical protein
MKKLIYSKPGQYQVRYIAAISSIYGQRKMISVFSILFLITFGFSGLLFGQVVIKIDPDKVKPVPSNLSGLTLEMANTEVWRYDNPELIRMLKESKVGWLRYFSGNTNNYYDWKVGQVTEPMYMQHMERHLDISYGGMHAIRGIGGLGFPDFVKLCSQVGAKMIITVNTMTDQVDQISDLARYVKDNHIEVEFWQLSNEPWAYLPDAKNMIFLDAVDHLNKAKPYNDAIKSVLPYAKTSVFTSVFRSGNQKQWVEDVKNYPDRYWDSVTFHDYTGGNGATREEGVLSGNKSLGEMVDKIKSVAVFPGAETVPLISTEWNSSMRGGGKHHRLTMYGAVYIAEFLARMSGTDRLNVNYLGYYNGIYNLISYNKNYRYDAVNAYEQGKILNTSTDKKVDFEPYYTVPGLALRLANEAINHSDGAYLTSSTGGGKVAVSATDSIAAVYAQAYRGMDNTTYLLITNKSARSYTARLETGQKSFNDHMPFQIGYVHADDYQKANDGSLKDLTIKRNKGTGHFTIPAYSVMKVSWKNTGRIPASPQFAGQPMEMEKDGRIVLKWKKEKGLKYTVGLSNRSGDAYKWINVDTVAQYEVKNLPANQSYYFVVKAISEYGESKMSREIKLETIVPGKPLLRNTYSLDKGLRVKWQSVPGASGYRVYCKSLKTGQIQQADAGNAVGYEFMGLNNDEQYNISVKAYNAYGEGQASNAITALPVKNLPYAPHGLSVSAENGVPVLSWIPSWSERHYETFENGMVNWKPVQGRWALYVENQYVIPTSAYKNVKKEGMSISILDQLVSDDVLVNLWYKVDSWTGSAGIIIRYKDQNNYYSLVYNSKSKTVDICKTLNGHTTVIQQYKSSAPSLNDYHVISFKINGDRLSGFWENSVKGFVLKDSSISGDGTIGVVATDQLAFFDKIDIYRPNGETFHVLRSDKPDGRYMYVTKGLNETRFVDQTAPKGTSYYKVEAEDKRGVKSQDESILATGFRY